MRAIRNGCTSRNDDIRERLDISPPQVAHVPEQQTNTKVIFIFARDLACLASDTCRLIEVVTHLCHTSPFVAAIIARHQRQSRTRRTEALPSLASINSMKRGIVPSCPRTRATMQAWLESPIPRWSDFGWWGGPVLTMDSRVILGYFHLLSHPVCVYVSPIHSE